MADLSPKFPPPVDRSVVQGSVRAIVTGMVLGGVLSLCNVYTGLKIGWGTNMSITAALIAYGFWHLLKTQRRPPLNLYENNVNQAAASAGAAISSAGLAAPIPALTIISGQVLSYPALVIWTLSVSWVGVIAAAVVRRQMIDRQKLAFPMGIATAETLREIYSRGNEALRRVAALGAGAAVAALVKLVELFASVPKLTIPGTLMLNIKGSATAVTLKNLTFALEPTLLMPGIGVLVGKRVGISMLLGGLVAWLVLGPLALEKGWAAGGKEDQLWFGTMGPWLLWPGAAMMVTSALTSVAFSLGSRTKRTGEAEQNDDDAPKPEGYEYSRNAMLIMGGVVSLIVVAVQVVLFEINVLMAILAVALTLVLAVVSTRITGETGLTPVGAMGKVTQLTFGILTPGNVAANLMTANVTGGAASQSGDLMNDLKTGRLLGAWPKPQILSQMCGVVTGALLGCLAYVILIPDPAKMLLTEEWPAPAAAQWKAVALVFKDGVQNLPPMSTVTLAVGAAVGVALVVIEKLVPKSVKPWIPSAGSVGLAFTLPAYTSVAICIGALLGEGIDRAKPKWAAAYKIAIGSGIIAGESLTGVGIAIQRIIADV